MEAGLQVIVLQRVEGDLLVGIGCLQRVAEVVDEAGELTLQADDVLLLWVVPQQRAQQAFAVLE